MSKYKVMYTALIVATVEADNMVEARQKFDEFEVIPSGNKETLDERESYWIRHYDSINNGFNTAKVGSYISDNSQKQLDEVTQCDLSQKKTKEVRHSSH